MYNLQLFCKVTLNDANYMKRSIVYFFNETCPFIFIE